MNASNATIIAQERGSSPVSHPHFPCLIVRPVSSPPSPVSGPVYTQSADQFGAFGYAFGLVSSQSVDFG